jgi:hypothetical protein
MFNQMARSRGLVTRCVLILMVCMFASLPLAALADSNGGAEPPITEPQDTGGSAGDPLVSLGLAMLASLWLVP